MSRHRWNCERLGQCYITEVQTGIDQLDDCFGGAVCPTDVDMIVERRGHFLVGEFKADGADESLGQEWMLKRMARGKAYTVLKVYAVHPPKLETVHRIEVWHKGALQQAAVKQSFKGLRKICRLWWKLADDPANENTDLDLAVRLHDA